MGENYCPFYVCYVIANAVKQSVGLMKEGLKASPRKLTNWFYETPIHFTRNDSYFYTFLFLDRHFL